MIYGDVACPDDTTGDSVRQGCTCPSYKDGYDDVVLKLEGPPYFENRCGVPSECSEQVPTGSGYGHECDLLVTDGTCVQTCTQGYTNTQTSQKNAGVYSCPHGIFTGVLLECVDNRVLPQHVLSELNMELYSQTRATCSNSSMLTGCSCHAMASYSRSCDLGAAISISEDGLQQNCTVVNTGEGAYAQALCLELSNFSSDTSDYRLWAGDLSSNSSCWDVAEISFYQDVHCVDELLSNFTMSASDNETHLPYLRDGDFWSVTRLQGDHAWIGVANMSQLGCVKVLTTPIRTTSWSSSASWTSSDPCPNSVQAKLQVYSGRSLFSLPRSPFLILLPSAALLSLLASLFASILHNNPIDTTQLTLATGSHCRQGS